MNHRTPRPPHLRAEDHDRAAADRLGFWDEQARRITWDRPYDTVLDWSDAPHARWYVGGRLNVARNCVDRHVEAGRGDKVALHFVGEPGDTRDLTYAELKDEVCRAANALTALGVAAGDRVAIYLPMIPEAVIAMLACARIGAPHTVVFGGFSADALASRIEDCGAKVVITADGGYRRGAASLLKGAVDEALEKVDVDHVLVVRRTGQEIGWDETRDLWWTDLVDAQSAEHVAEAFDAEHPLFIMYTSGTTGRPKGILHTSGGYLVQCAYTTWGVFDLDDDDVFWCTADVGWVTGHSYVAYGPTAIGATQVLYEGTPDTPHQGRWWEIVQEHGVTQLYTAPTAIRTFMKWGDDIPARYDLSSLRLLGSVGESINPEAHRWYRTHIGGGRTPVVDTWWQTETGAQMLTPLPGVTRAKPGAAHGPVPGICAEVVDDAGDPVGPGETGYLVLTEPWPAMLRTIWGDDERYRETYWSRFPGRYFAGDGAMRDEDGVIWVLGRVDDVMNVSGHRLSTTEIESALVSHPSVAEAAVVGASDETTGQAVVAFVILRDSAASADVQELRAHVAREIGPIAKPRQVLVVPELPKTRSGKIMRRLLRDIAEDREVGDATTLADANVVASLVREHRAHRDAPQEKEKMNPTDPTDRGTVLVLQHISCEPPATYEEILTARGLAVHRVELDEGEPLPDHHDFAAVIVMGGPMGALDDAAHPWLAAERAYIARAVAAGVPYWGVCLGAQLLAASLGARVYTGEVPEVGTYDVELTADAAADPVFGLLPDRFSVFQWHSDTFDLPAGARRLAASASYDNQVFAVGSAYAVQFHVEVGADLAAEWAVVDSYRTALEDLYGAAGTRRVLDELAETAEANRKVATTVFEAWLEAYVGQ